MSEHLRKPKRVYGLLLAVVLGCGFVVPMRSQSSAPLSPEPVPAAHVEKDGSPSHPSSQDAAVEVTHQLSAEETRQAQIEADTQELYVLSAELRTEVAKTYKESLSLAVLKKAEEVEKLARSLKILMNQEAAAARK